MWQWLISGRDPQPIRCDLRVRYSVTGAREKPIAVTVAWIGTHDSHAAAGELMRLVE